MSLTERAVSAREIDALRLVLRKARLLYSAMKRDEWPGHNHTYVRELRDAIAAASQSDRGTVE